MADWRRRWEESRRGESKLPTLPATIKDVVEIMVMFVELQFLRLKMWVLRLGIWLLETATWALGKLTAYLERLKRKVNEL